MIAIQKTSRLPAERQQQVQPQSEGPTGGQERNLASFMFSRSSDAIISKGFALLASFFTYTALSRLIDNHDSTGQVIQNAPNSSNVLPPIHLNEALYHLFNVADSQIILVYAFAACASTLAAISRYDSYIEGTSKN